MKKIILTAAVAVILSAANTTVSFAQSKTPVEKSASVSNPKVNLHAYNEMKFRLVASNLTERSRIAIKNQFGDVLYSEYAGKADAYSKLYDLSNLPDGSYAFVVETNGGQAEVPFVVKTTRTLTTASL